MRLPWIRINARLLLFLHRCDLDLIRSSEEQKGYDYGNDLCDGEGPPYCGKVSRKRKQISHRQQNYKLSCKRNEHWRKSSAESLKGGDYYNITSGKRILSKLYGQTKVQKLVLLLECSIHNSTLLESLPFLYSNISRGEVTAKQVKRNLLPALSKAGINPLAIPNSWNIEILLNPTKLITDF